MSRGQREEAGNIHGVSFGLGKQQSSQATLVSPRPIRARARVGGRPHLHRGTDAAGADIAGDKQCQGKTSLVTLTNRGQARLGADTTRDRYLFGQTWLGVLTCCLLGVVAHKALP